MYNNSISSIKKNTISSDENIDRTLNAIESKFRDYLSTIRSRAAIAIRSIIEELKKNNIRLKNNFEDEIRIEFLKRSKIEIEKKIDEENKNYRNEYAKFFLIWYDFLKEAEDYYKPNLRETSISFEEYSKKMSKVFDAINIGVISTGKNATEEEKEQNRKDGMNERLRFKEMINLKLKNNTGEGLRILRDLEHKVIKLPEEFEKSLNDTSKEISGLIDEMIREKREQTKNNGVIENGLVMRGNENEKMKGLKEAILFLKDMRKWESYAASATNNIDDEARKSN